MFISCKKTRSGAVLFRGFPFDGGFRTIHPADALHPVFAELGLPFVGIDPVLFLLDVVKLRIAEARELPEREQQGDRPFVIC